MAGVASEYVEKKSFFAKVFKKTKILIPQDEVVVKEEGSNLMSNELKVSETNKFIKWTKRFVQPSHMIDENINEVHMSNVTGSSSTLFMYYNLATLLMVWMILFAFFQRTRSLTSSKESLIKKTRKSPIRYMRTTSQRKIDHLDKLFNAVEESIQCRKREKQARKLKLKMKKKKIKAQRYVVSMIGDEHNDHGQLMIENSGVPLPTVQELDCHSVLMGNKAESPLLHESKSSICPREVLAEKSLYHNKSSPSAKTHTPQKLNKGLLLRFSSDAGKKGQVKDKIPPGYIRSQGFQSKSDMESSLPSP